MISSRRKICFVDTEIKLKRKEDGCIIGQHVLMTRGQSGKPYII